MDEEIPRLQRDIEIVPFDGASAGRYLVIQGGRHYLVSAALREVMETLIRYHAGDARQAPTGDLARAASLAREHLPAQLFEGAGGARRRSPFAISAGLLTPRSLRYIVPGLSRLVAPLPAALLLPLVLGLHLSVATRIFSADFTGISAAELTVCYALFLLGVLLHELGHVSAAYRYSSRIGHIGVGLYLVFPVFYSDVSHAWSLSRRQRAAVDLGGLYFQGIFLAAVDLLVLLRGDPLWAALSWMSTLAMLHTLNPFFKFDGYWLLSDLSGAVNLHAKVGATLRAVAAYCTGRAPASALHGDALALLVPYSLLSGLFALGFCGFLLGRIAVYRQGLPPQLLSWLEAARQCSGALDWLRAGADLLAIIAMPALMLLALCFYLRRMLGYFRADTDSLPAAGGQAGQARG